MQSEERVKAELIEDLKKDAAAGTFLFPLRETVLLYNERRTHLHLPEITRGTALKNMILDAFQGDIEVRGEGNQPKTLVFTEGLNTLVKETLQKRKFDQEMQAIVETAKIIRQDIFRHKGFLFSGEFSELCQAKSIPNSLKVLMTMILKGTALKDQEKTESQAALTAGQILFFNAQKKPSNKVKSDVVRHNVEREPPLPIYLGLLLHKEFRCKKLINTLHHIGLSVGYHRVLKIEKHIASTLCEQYEQEGAVVPRSAKRNTFTVCALDNIDWNTSSNLSLDSFHGTSISLHQQPTDASINQEKFKLSNQGYKIELPETYTLVDCTTISKISAPPKRVTSPYFNFVAEQKKEQQWLELGQNLLVKTSTTSLV